MGAILVNTLNIILLCFPCYIYTICSISELCPCKLLREIHVRYAYFSRQDHTHFWLNVKMSGLCPHFCYHHPPNVISWTMHGLWLLAVLKDISTHLCAVATFSPVSLSLGIINCRNGLQVLKLSSGTFMFHPYAGQSCEFGSPPALCFMLPIVYVATFEILQHLKNKKKKH